MSVTSVWKKIVSPDHNTGPEPVYSDAHGWKAGERIDPIRHRRGGPMGAARTRVDGPLKVTGAAPFAADIPVDGMLYAALVFSTIATGRITSLDCVAAEAAAGIALVMTHENAPRMRTPPRIFSSGDAAFGDDLPVMQDDRVYWNGQPVAVVVGRSQQEADYAASLIQLGYEREPARTDFNIAKKASRASQAVFGEPAEYRSGDAEEALTQSTFSVDQIYRTPYQNHNALEPHSVTAMWHGDALRLHDSTQGVKSVAATLATIFDLRKDQVRVTSPYVGGGFGGKIMWQHQVLAAAAAKLAGFPVRLCLSREGVYRVVGGRALTEQRVAIGADHDGRFRAVIHTGVSATNTHAALPEPYTQPTKILYGADTMHLNIMSADLDMVANTFMRAPGEATGSFALESAIDELAELMQLDPIDLRLRNEPEIDPIQGTPFSSRHLAGAFRSGAARFGWSDRGPVRGRREGNWWIGVGTAASTYPYIRYPGAAARMTLHHDGRMTVDVAASDMGMGTQTVHMQIVAERAGLTPEQVTFRYGDSDLPGNVLAGGAQQTASIGLAVMAANDALVIELLRITGNDSVLAGLQPAEVRGTDGGLASVKDRSTYETYRSILARAGLDSLVVEGSAPPPTENQEWSMHSYGAVFAEVRVHAVTGETRVSRLLGSFDCGRILNPRTAASQLRGGMIMGIGLALMEETQLDTRSGRVVNPSFAEYHIPVHADVPPIEVLWTDLADPRAPMGARGVGEIGIVGVGAVISNAIYNATGKRLRDLPLTLDRLL